MDLASVDNSAKRNSPASQRMRSRHISFPPHYERIVRDRMSERGVGRSEALRQLIDDSQHRPPAPPPRDLRRHLIAIQAQCAVCRRTISDHDRCQAIIAIETTVKEIERIMAAGR